MTEAERATIAGHPVLLYDGVCALCHGVVRFVLRNDRDGSFRFAALESDAARELLGTEASVKDGVAVIVDLLTPGQRVLRRSDAVVEVLRLLGWRWRSHLLAAVPRRLREAGYSIVAGVRYRIFGRYAVCPLPPHEVRERFFGG
jgi:predicted DCC family thiol-disulfide oxidoreductase YuxK